VLGLREANHGSGVGLFNQLLARRLEIPYLLLDDYPFPGPEHPLISLKFEELAARQRRSLLTHLLRSRPQPAYSLFLHTLEHSELERTAIRGASQVFCGNDGIFRWLREQDPCLPFHRAFAPTLIAEDYQRRCQPATVELFYFGMASKIDRPRFLRLRELLDETAPDFKLLCSLAVHQTSDGTCISQAQGFLQACFGERFVYLGTLDDMGIAYFLNGPRIFVGFYRGGVRSNNTTFNTALRYGKRIITNLDADSPPEIQDSPRILDIDQADAATLRQFLADDRDASAQRLAQLFTWDELIERVLAPWQLAQVA
jgi:hypothetical protein